MSEHRITPQTPLRDLGHLDYERCAALHNMIVHRGWQDSGRSLSELDQSSWWDLYSTQMDTSRISPDLVSFLQSAQQGHILARPIHNLHRYLSALTIPQYVLNDDAFYENAIYGPDEGDSHKRRFVTLYMATNLGPSHPLGIVYDQDERKAMMHMSMHDSSVTMNGRQKWVRLEEILEAMLQMMDEGKVCAVKGDYEKDGQQERRDPWIMPSFSERDLRDTLEAWNELLDHIEAKMNLSLDGLDLHERTVFEQVISDNDMLPQGCFARRFLESARRPRFTFIAPGLRLAQTQPFANVPLDSVDPDSVGFVDDVADDEDIDDKLRPVLLFQNDQLAHLDVEEAPWGQMMPRPIFYPHFQRAVSRNLRSMVVPTMPIPAGLYLTESEPKGSMPFEDGVKLILPYAFGDEGYACTSDGALFGEDTIHQGPEARSHGSRGSELYQSGYNPFIERHDVQIRRVLWHWASMIKSGKWEVGPDGVQGGIDKWREADTPDRWHEYVLPRTW